jgi:photosystem II 22kDa protein
VPAGFAAAVLGEIITGKGALAQFNIETGVPITDIDGLVAGIAIFNLIAALLPAKGRLVLDESELADDRKAGSLQDPKVSMLEPKKFFGFSGFGFNKENELFVGRMAQLGFAAGASVPRL